MLNIFLTLILNQKNLNPYYRFPFHSNVFTFNDESKLNKKIQSNLKNDLELFVHYLNLIIIR